MSATVAPWIDAANLADDDRVKDVELPSPLTLADCVQAATDLLHRWTGRQYGVVTVTVRPVRAGPTCSCFFDMCGCLTAEISLRRAVTEVSEVTVDGVVLAPSAYTVYDQSLLVRTDGGWWICCQSLSRPLGEPGTWSFRLTYGHDAPMAGKVACHELAVHTALALANKESKLPQRAASVDRKGIRFDLDRPRGAQGRGKMQVRGPDRFTGITLVDQFVLAENPDGLTRRASVSSPDVPKLRRVPT